MRIILASASPRRREILASLGVDFEILTADADESCDVTDPCGRVEAISAVKCRAVLERLTAERDSSLDDTLIIASDTLVTLDGIFLGKPRDREDARRMIRLLSGRAHAVVSGIALWYRGRVVTASELTEVVFAPMTEAEIETYLDTDESFGKAGGYAIQGHAARYVTGIRGDYFNVVGLPIRLLYSTLDTAFGIRL